MVANHSLKYYFESFGKVCKKPRLFSYSKTCFRAEKYSGTSRSAEIRQMSTGLLCFYIGFHRVSYIPMKIWDPVQENWKIVYPKKHCFSNNQKNLIFCTILPVNCTYLLIVNLQTRSLLEALATKLFLSTVAQHFLKLFSDRCGEVRKICVSRLTLFCDFAG